MPFRSFRSRSSARLRRVLLSLPILFFIAAHAPLAYGLSFHAHLQPAPSATTAAHETWSGIYMGDNKIGFSVERTEPTFYLGKPALKQTGRETTAIQLLGQSVRQQSVTETTTDLKGRPIVQYFDIASNGSRLLVSATYDYTAHKIHCKVGKGPDATSKDIDIPADANIAADTNTLTEGKALAAGKTYSFSYLEPVSVALETATLSVTGKARIRANSDKVVDAYVVLISLAVGQMTSWVDEKGDLLVAEMALGPVSLKTVTESKEQAQNLGSISPAIAHATAPGAKHYTPPSDFAVATAIRTDKPIENPRTLRSLKVVIAGIPTKKLLISDGRQHEALVGAKPVAPYQAEVTVTAEQIDEDKPPADSPVPAGMASYLGKAAYLPVDAPEITEQAARIRGDQKSPFKIAVAIRNWVHETMTPDASIGVPRSATDILGRPRGVCRDYATLFTALARASGIPTRLCAGIVYAQDRFYYHAWAECYLGNWIAFDPTLFDPLNPVPFVDASHIKFAQGDVTQMFDSIAVVGRLKITVRSAMQ